ncbi:F-box domain containing protein [Tanacetum coccineum]
MMKEDATDWISQLPEFIVHHILSLLYSPKELVRMSVLSKTWFALTASFPILDFDIEKLYDVIKKSGTPFDLDLYTNECFFKYVEYTTFRFCHQNVTSVHTLNLITELLEGNTQVDSVNRCLESVLKKGVKELKIDIDPLWMCLTELFQLIEDFLQLVSVTINEKELKRLTAGCPLLEELDVTNCKGFKIFCVYGLQNLQKVRLFFVEKVEKIDIQAPDLWYLEVWDLERKGAPCMNLASCKKLTSLDYYGDLSKGLADFSNNFPFLEDFFWDPIDRCNDLKLTSHSLKKFILHGQCDLEELDICAPNLLLFDCKGHSHNPGPLVRNAYPSKARVECYPDEAADTIWFQKFKRFLDKKNGFKELKLQVHIRTGFIDVEELKVNQSPPLKLEHVELDMTIVQELVVYLSVMDAIFWCCCPRSLTLNLKSIWDIEFEDWSQIVKILLLVLSRDISFGLLHYLAVIFFSQFTYEKLLEQEDQAPTIIQLALSSSSKAKKQFSDLNSLLKALPHNGPRQTIIFIKEEGVQVLEIDITNRNLMHIPPYGPIFRLPDILLSVSSLTSLKLCNYEEVIKILTTSCPLLEELTVIDCSGFKRFCVYGLKNLQIVRFCYEYGVERIDIEAPNLCFLLLSSSHEENVTLPCVNDHIDDFEELKLIQSAPYELEHVDLDRVMIQEVPAYLALVEAILWCCCPQSLTLILKSNYFCVSFDELSHIVKVRIIFAFFDKVFITLYWNSSKTPISLALHSISCHNKVDNSLLLSQFTSEKLLQQEDEGKINIRIEMCWSSKAKKQFSDINSLLAALPGDQPGETVTFIKEVSTMDIGSIKQLNTGSLTNIGPKMTEFPLDPHIAKPLLTCEEFSCVSEVLKIVFMLSVMSVLFSPKDSAEESDAAHAKFFRA